MNWKKRLITLVCAALLVLCPALLGTARADNVEIYLMAENDVILDLPLESMPAWIGGVLYVPCTAFDGSFTGVNLGVSFGQIRGDNGVNLMLYSLSDTLTFDLNAGTCVDRSGRQMEMRAVSRNGMIFVPLRAVCGYFGLRYSYTPTSYGTLIRITNGQEWLSNSDFILYGERGLRDRYNTYLRQLNPAAPQVSPQATPTPSHTQSVEEPNRSSLTVYLSFRCTGGGEAEAILDRLDSYGVRALFLFRPSDLSGQEEVLRRVVGSGHALGLSVGGDTLAEVEEELSAGSALLERLVRVRPHTVCLEEAGREVASALEGEGWACWQPQLDQTGETRSITTRANALMSAFESRTGSVRVMLDDEKAAADVLSRLLPRMVREDYRVRLPVETLI
nr:hypothetical protein [uncultured Flavonifractor sp.]